MIECVVEMVSSLYLSVLYLAEYKYRFKLSHFGLKCP